MRKTPLIGLALASAVGLTSCAALGALGQVVEPPRFELDDRSPELRLRGGQAGLPTAGATLRFWVQVENPNAFGLTLQQVAGDLFLEGHRAADVDFPLGLPLSARGREVVPMEIGIDFAELPGLADAAIRALTGQPLGFRVDGTATLDAGALGSPRFGPMTMVEGSVRPFR